MAFPVSVRGYRDLLRSSASFRRLWAAQLISGSGDWFYSVAIYSLLLELTGSAASVAWAAILQILPMLLLGPTAGAVNDRFSRRKTMLASDLLRAGFVLCMLGISRADQIWLLYLLLGLEIGTAAFFEAGRNAILPSIVRREDLPAANALGSTTWSLTATLGAALGGGAVAYFGRQAVFWGNSLSFLVSAFFVYRIRILERYLAGQRQRSPLEAFGLRPTVEGIAYVARRWRLAALLTLKLGLGVLGARVVLSTILGAGEFEIGNSPALGMALLFGFQGLGSILGPLAFGQRIGRSQASARATVLLGYIAAGVGYMLFSGARFVLLAGLFLVLAHAGASLVWVGSTTLLHLNTDGRYLGRVFAADLGLFMGIIYDDN